MPFYYTVSRTPGTPGTACTSNGSANTLSTHFKGLTAANGLSLRIMGLFASARFGTAGGGSLYVIRPGAAGSGGTATTPEKKNPNNPAATSTWVADDTAITAGTTPKQQLSVGVAQTGGQGGWVALEEDDAIALAVAAASTGLEVASKFNASSVLFDPTIDIKES
jgi:hypothetical protein